MHSKKKTELILEETYNKFHHRKFVEPDPLQFLYKYPEIRDREIVGLIASSLALGRVNSIIDIINKILKKLPSPYENITNCREEDLYQLFGDFKYRFYIGEDLISLLLAIKKIIEVYGSLNQCFCSTYSNEENTILPALNHFVETLGLEKPLKMLAKPSKGSACKRLMLYLRWMIREDVIDPGGWEGISKEKLIIPLDTHMFKVGRLLNLTKRNDAAIKTALEITDGLKKYDHMDPTRFDFSLTRPGIHPDLDYSEFTTDSQSSILVIDK